MRWASHTHRHARGEGGTWCSARLLLLLRPCPHTQQQQQQQPPPLLRALAEATQGRGVAGCVLKTLLKALMNFKAL